MGAAEVIPEGVAEEEWDDNPDAAALLDAAGEKLAPLDAVSAALSEGAAMVVEARAEGDPIAVPLSLGVGGAEGEGVRVTAALPLPLAPPLLAEGLPDTRDVALGDAEAVGSGGDGVGDTVPPPSGDGLAVALLVPPLGGVAVL